MPHPPSTLPTYGESHRTTGHRSLHGVKFVPPLPELNARAREGQISSNLRPRSWRSTVLSSAVSKNSLLHAPVGSSGQGMIGVVGMVAHVLTFVQLCALRRWSRQIRRRREHARLECLGHLAGLWTGRCSLGNRLRGMADGAKGTRGSCRMESGSRDVMRTSRKMLALVLSAHGGIVSAVSERIIYHHHAPRSMEAFSCLQVSRTTR